MSQARSPRKAPAAARPAGVRIFAAVLRAAVRDVRARMGGGSGMWFLLASVAHLTIALFLLSQVAAFRGALAPPQAFGETRSAAMLAMEAAARAKPHPVAPAVALGYAAATLALWIVLGAARRRWRGRQLHVMALLLVPGTLLAGYVVGHVLLVSGR